MIYEENKKWNRSFAAAAAVLLLLLFSPFFLNVQELFSDEGFFLAAVRELDRIPPLMKVQGEIGYGGFPLFPFLVKLLILCGCSAVTALRLVPFISIAVLCGVIFLTAWKAGGLTAGMVGIGAMLINFVTMEKCFNGNPVLLGTLGVFSAWMVWFAFGVWRANWKLAWLFSLIIAGMTFYAIGFTGLLLIVFPMLFHRRPLTVWAKPRGIGFLLGIGFFLFFLLLWGIPRWTAPEDLAWHRTTVSFPSIGSYCLHLLTFPFDAALRFLPWTLFAWAPFCPAIVPLDDNPLLSRYLRTLFLGTFVLLWLSPLTESRDMFFMIPPLAVLVGINYWIVVRRYGRNLLKFFQFFAVAILILCTAAFSYLLIPFDALPSVLSRFLQSMEDSPYWLPALIGSAAGAVFALTAIFMCMSGTRVWFVITILSATLILPYRCLVIPYQNLVKNKQAAGLDFRNALPRNEHPNVVYRMFDIPPIYCEMHYFGIRIKTISSPAELPEKEPVVYVFSSAVPSAPERTWECLHKKEHRNSTIELWRGKLKTEEDYE